MRLVSVIIPTHNRAGLLQRAIISVTQQTYQNFEIIIVDDASNDHTKALLLQLKSLENRIRIITNDRPLGANVSRNKGLYASQGKWLAFLDDDDTWLPHKLEKQINALTQQKTAIACSTGYRIRYPFHLKKTVHPPRQVTLDHLLPANSLGGTSVCMGAAHTIKAIGGFNEQLQSAQDWDLWVRLAMQGDIITIREPLVEYYVHFNPRITNNMHAKYNGSRMFYFRYKPCMQLNVKRMHIGFLCYIRSRQAKRPLRFRAKYLWLSLLHSPPRTGIAYVISSLPRMLLHIACHAGVELYSLIAIVCIIMFFFLFHL